MAAIPPPPTSTEDFLRADTLTEREKALRDMFCAQYLIDFNSVAAAMRCGFPRNFAQEYAQKFMEEAYVQQKLTQLTYTPTDPDAERQFNQRRIMQQLLKEAHYHGPGSSHSARVAALTKLAILEGMEPPKKVEADVTHRGGVMKVPTVATDIDAWEGAAVASQEALRGG